MSVATVIRNDTASSTTIATNLEIGLQAVDSTGAAFAVLKPVTAGGCSTLKLLSAATTNATSLKASAGQLYGVIVSNHTAAAKFLKFYNKASAPTVGSDTIVMTLGIQANQTIQFDFPSGFPFATGIAFATTLLIADSDTTAVALNDMAMTFLYK